MRNASVLVVGLVWSWACGTSEPLPESVDAGAPEASAPEALEAARAWVLANPDGWTVDVGCGEVFERGPSTPPMDCVNGTQWFQIDSGGVKLSLFFDCDVRADLASLRAGLDSAVIDALPHGVELEGWRFYVRTPVSRFSETLTVQSFTDRDLAVEIVTPLFAISGHSRAQRCQVEDGSPDGCSVRIEHPIPLTLRLCGTLPASLL